MPLIGFTTDVMAVDESCLEVSLKVILLENSNFLFFTIQKGAHAV